MLDDINEGRGEAIVEAGKAHSGRACGTCSMCCYALDIETPELSKPANSWCRHCRPGHGGCSIYATRPPVCRAFGCAWLVNEKVADYWFPQRAKIVAHMAHEDEGTLVYAFNVDQRFPNGWREEPYFGDIKRCGVGGLEGSSGFKFQTVVHVGKNKYLILPHREVDIAAKAGVIMQTGPHSFEWVEAKSKQHAKELIKAMTKMVDDLQRNPVLRDQLVAELRALGYAA